MARIKLMAFMEADTVTGPAKSLIEFAKAALPEDNNLPGVDILITTFHRTGAKEDFIHAVEQAGLPVAVIPEKRVLDIQVLPELRALIKEWSPDIIQTSNVKSHFLVKMLGLHRHYPWTAFHHGYTTTDTKMLVYNQLNRYSLRSARHVFVVCDAFRQEIVQMGVQPERISVHHNMVVPFVRPASSQVEALRSTLGLPGRARVVLCVGRFSREKGHNDLIRAAATLHQESPDIDFRLVLLGEGPEREPIRQLSQELGIVDLIIFAGHHRDISAYYAMADVFALPSHSEGSPNVLLEAMSAGIPTIATSVGGVPEIVVHEESALLTQKGDSAEMARGIRRLLLDTPLREKLITHSRQVTERYTSASYSRDIVLIYKKILGMP